MKIFNPWLSAIVALLLSSAVLAGCGSSSSAPTAPTGVTATAGNNHAYISWAAVSGATSYNIYYSSTAGVTPATGAKLSGVTTPYLLVGLTNGTNYFFVVTAANVNGESAASAQASCTLALRPEGVALAPVDGLITISWDQAPSAVSYNIYWSTTPGVSPANGTKIAGVTTSSYPFAEPNDGTIYYLVVTWVDANGVESAASSEVSAAASLPPLAPQAVTAVPGNGQVTISWTAVPGEAYNIYWSNDASKANRESGTKITGVTTASYLQSRLNNGITYYYEVTAVNENNGESIESGEVSATPSLN